MGGDRRRARAEVVRLALLAHGALLLASCGSARDTASMAAYRLNPFGSTEVSVRSVEVNPPYLLVDVAGQLEELRLLTPTSEACVRLLHPEARLHYAKAGVFGRLLGDDESCDPVGVASLERWRDRRPRARTRGPVPRSTARFSLVAEGERYLFVRGRFALASRVGIPAGWDLVALLPKDDACRSVAARGNATLEFRHAGREPFRMLDGNQSCVVAGFATPIEPLSP